MRRRGGTMLLTVALLGASACGLLPDDESEARARRILLAFPEHPVEEVRTWIDPDQLPERDVEYALKQIQSLLRFTTEPEVECLESNRTLTIPLQEGRDGSRFDQGVVDTYLFHLRGAEVGALARLVVEFRGDRFLIHGLHVNVASPQPPSASLPSPENLSWFHYLAVLLALAILAVNVLALVGIARSDLKRKWAWAILPFVGVGKLQVVFAPLSFAEAVRGAFLFHLTAFSLGFAKSPLTAPWVLTLAVPLGALVVLVRLRRGRGGRATPEASRTEDVPQVERDPDRATG